jgi:hypothetical protein
LRFSVQTVVSIALTLLLSATAPFEWGPNQDRALTDLKAAVTSAPVLQPFQTDAKHLVMADASSVGLGAATADLSTPPARPKRIAAHPSCAQLARYRLAFSCCLVHLTVTVRRNASLRAGQFHWYNSSSSLLADYLSNSFLYWYKSG